MDKPQAIPLALPAHADAADAAAGAQAGISHPLQALNKFRSACAYLALLVGLLPRWPGSDLAGAALVLIALLASWRDLRQVPRAIVLMVLVFGASAWWWAPQLLISAVAGTAGVATLVIAVMLLSITLGRSRDLGVLAAGLLSGRPLPRYLGLGAATAFLAMPLNFGSVGVMGAMVTRVIERGGDGGLTRNATRAVMRGFGIASICSPLSISLAITLSFMPEISVQQLLAISLPFGAGFLLLGALFREPEEQSAAAAGASLIAAQAGSAGWAWLRFGAFIAAICIGAFAFYEFGEMAYSRAVAISCTLAVGAGLIAARLRDDAASPPSIAHIGNELSVMGGSAFLGGIAGGAGLFLLGPDVVLPGAAWPLLAFAVPWLLFAGGAVGLNPIVTGTIAGAMLAPLWPSTALLGLGFGMLSGWGLTVAGTPHTANSMLLSRLTGYDARTAAWRWNLKLSLCALTSAGLLAALLTQLP